MDLLTACPPLTFAGFLIARATIASAAEANAAGTVVTGLHTMGFPTPRYCGIAAVLFASCIPSLPLSRGLFWIVRRDVDPTHLDLLRELIGCWSIYSYLGVIGETPSFARLFAKKAGTPSTGIPAMLCCGLGFSLILHTTIAVGFVGWGLVRRITQMLRHGIPRPQQSLASSGRTPTR